MTDKTLNIAAFLPRSKANGPGLRSVLWVQGCPFRCEGCFNPDFLPFHGGQAVGVDEAANWLLAEPDTEGVSFSGGEPFAQADALAEVAAQVKAAGKGVLIFTGYESETLRNSANPGIRRLWSLADLLVAGPYRADQPCREPLRASANQELVFLTDRYRAMELGRRRVEFRIGAGGEVSVTGFPAYPPPQPSPTRGEGVLASQPPFVGKPCSSVPSPIVGEGCSSVPSPLVGEG